MTQTVLHSASQAVKATLLATLITTVGCSSLMHPPTAQSVARLQPSGIVSVIEDFVAGLGGGGDSLDFQGQTYPFQLIGTVVGLGGGLSKTTASGEV